MVAVAEEGEEGLLAGSLRGRDDGEDDCVEGDVVELSRRGEALDARRDVCEDGANVAVQDVVKPLLVSVGETPRGRRLKPSKGRIVLAEGEVSGHAHTLDAAHAELIDATPEGVFLRIIEPTPLEHQEHAPILLPPGNYRVVKQREYGPPPIQEPSEAPVGDVLPLREVRSRFSELVDEVARTHERITVTRNGKPAAILISPDDLASMQETVEVLADADLMRQLIESRAEVDAGVPRLPLDDVNAEFDRRRTKRAGRGA